MISRSAPLNDAGVTKADVNAFWTGQTFDLGLQDYQGNCTGCFLKDQADLSRALAEPETDAPWWLAMRERYKDFGGRDHDPTQLLREAPLRYRIEGALRANTAPDNDGTVSAHRFKFVVIQEKKRLTGQTKGFSCACEGSNALAGMDEDDEAYYIESLP